MCAIGRHDRFTAPLAIRQPTLLAAIAVGLVFVVLASLVSVFATPGPRAGALRAGPADAARGNPLIR